MTPCRPGRNRIPIVGGRERGRPSDSNRRNPPQTSASHQPGRTARKTITRRKHCECSALWTCTCFTPPWNISYIYGRCAKLCFEDLRLSVTRKKRCERTALCTYLRFASISVYQKIVLGSMSLCSTLRFGVPNEPSGNSTELEERVRQWLEEIPDGRAKEDLLITKNWKTFIRKSSSFTSHLEDWEDESLFDALESRGRFSRIFCCFQGFYRKRSQTSQGRPDQFSDRKPSLEENGSKSEIFKSLQEEAWKFTDGTERNAMEIYTPGLPGRSLKPLYYPELIRLCRKHLQPACWRGK